MTFCCKGICNIVKPKLFSTVLCYELGYKRCTLCSVFFKTSDLSCSCCGARLRTKSRTNFRRKISKKRYSISL